MKRMIRKQIQLTPELEEALKRKAEELGLSQSELVREYIDKGMQQPTEAERKKAREELIASMEERAKMKVPQTGRRWTRDELYEERLERYS